MCVWWGRCRRALGTTSKYVVEIKGGEGEGGGEDQCVLRSTWASLGSCGCLSASAFIALVRVASRSDNNNKFATALLLHPRGCVTQNWLRVYYEY